MYSVADNTKLGKNSFTTNLGRKQDSNCTHTFSEENMSSLVHDAVTDREVIDESMDRLLTWSDEVDAVHCAERFSLFVDVFHHYLKANSDLIFKLLLRLQSNETFLKLELVYNNNRLSS